MYFTFNLNLMQSTYQPEIEGVMIKSKYILCLLFVIFSFQFAFSKSFSLAASLQIYDNPYVDTGVASAYIIGSSSKKISAIVVKFNVDKKFKGYGYFFIDTVSKKILEDNSDIYNCTITTETELINSITPLLVKYGIEIN